MVRDVLRRTNIEPDVIIERRAIESVDDREDAERFRRAFVDRAVRLPGVKKSSSIGSPSSLASVQPETSAKATRAKQGRGERMSARSDCMARSSIHNRDLVSETRASVDSCSRYP